MPVDAPGGRKINFKDPKVIAVGIGLLGLVWYFFLRKPSTATSASGVASPSPSQGQQSLAPSSGGGASGESGNASGAVSGADLLGVLANSIDNLVNQEGLALGFARDVTNQTYGFASNAIGIYAYITQGAVSANTELARTALSNPPVNTTVFYPVYPNPQQTQAPVASVAPPHYGGDVVTPSYADGVPAFGSNYGQGGAYSGSGTFGNPNPPPGISAPINVNVNPNSNYIPAAITHAPGRGPLD